MMRKSQVTQLLAGTRFGALRSAEPSDRDVWGVHSLREPSPALNEGVPNRDQTQLQVLHLCPDRLCRVSRNPLSRCKESPFHPCPPPATAGWALPLTWPEEDPGQFSESRLPLGTFATLPGPLKSSHGAQQVTPRGPKTRN